MFDNGADACVCFSPFSLVIIYISGGTFALYSLISRYARICLIPNQQAEDELVSRYKHHPKPSATLRRAQWMKNLLETSKLAKITLFFLTILATALAISDCMLNPPISGNGSSSHMHLTPIKNLI
jgi:hypothetical protein